MSPKRLRRFFVLGISAALLSSSCNSPDRVLDIPTAVNTAPKSIEAIKDYQEALSAIVPVMVRELKVPAPQGRVYFYSDAGVYQAALTTELKTRFWPEGESKEIRQWRNKLEFELFKLTLNVATQTGAVTMGQKVFIAEWSMMRLPWTDRVKTLAHELTHVIQANLSAGRSELMPRWLGEGFADWVSFKVVDALGAKDFLTIKCGKHAVMKYLTCEKLKPLKVGVALAVRLVTDSRLALCITWSPKTARRPSSNIFVCSKTDLTPRKIS
jgi:hypothetical protein